MRKGEFPCSTVRPYLLQERGRTLAEGVPRQTIRRLRNGRSCQAAEQQDFDFRCRPTLTGGNKRRRAHSGERVQTRIRVCLLYLVCNKLARIPFLVFHPSETRRLSVAMIGDNLPTQEFTRGKTRSKACRQCLPCLDRSTVRGIDVTFTTSLLTQARFRRLRRVSVLRCATC